MQPHLLLLVKSTLELVFLEAKNKPRSTENAHTPQKTHLKRGSRIVLGFGGFLEGVRDQADDLVQKGHSSDTRKLVLRSKFGPTQQIETRNTQRFVLYHHGGRLISQLQSLDTDAECYWDENPQNVSWSRINIGDEGRLFVIQRTIEVSVP